MNAQDEIRKKLIETDDYQEEIKSQRFQISDLRHVNTNLLLVAELRLIFNLQLFI